MTTPAQEKEYWNKVGELDDPKPEIWGMEDYDGTTKECVEHLLDGIPLSRQNRRHALEIGCGIGRLTGLLAPSFARMVAVDTSGSLIGRAAERCQSYIQFIVSGGRSLPIGDEEINFIYSMATFQHLDEKTVIGYIRESFRVLQPGGILRFQYVEGGYHDDFNHKYMHDLEIKPWLEEAGFINVTIEQGLMHSAWSWATGRKP